MFPLFAYLFVLSALFSAATAVRAVMLWRSILVPSAAQRIVPFMVAFAFISAHFAAWSLPDLVGASSEAVAVWYDLSQFFLILALAAASCSILGFRRYPYLAATLLIAGGIWITYLRFIDFSPAIIWTGYGLRYAEPAIRPVYKLLVSLVASAVGVQVVRRARQLQREDQEPFSHQQFMHFAVGGLAYLGALIAYSVLAPLNILTFLQSLFTLTFLSLIGAVLFYRALTLEPYLPRQLEHINGRRS